MNTWFLCLLQEKYFIASEGIKIQTEPLKNTVLVLSLDLS